MRITLAVITMVYLLLISIQDLRERAFYSFPANILTTLWSVFAIRGMDMTDDRVILVVLGYIAIYVVFNALRVWGEGDSDLLMLGTAIYWSVKKSAFGIDSIIYQIILLVLVLLLAIGVGFFETKIRKKRLEKLSSIALAPGFFLVVGAVLLKGVILC